MFFPIKYTKPVLLGIVEASENGWSAGCDEGTGPGTAAGLDCKAGNAANTEDGNSNMMLYTDHRQARWFEVEDINKEIGN